MEHSARLKIGITGVSGFLGSYLAETIKRAGHIAVGFSRSPRRKVAGCSEMRKFSLEKLDLEGLDAVVHLAGASVFGPWTERRKDEILASRRDGTRAVVDAMLAGVATGKHFPKILISASAIGFYGEGGEKEIGETSPPGTGFLAEVCQIWEKEALRAREGGIRVVNLRLGMVLGRDGGALKMMRPFFLLGLGAKIGRGQQWVSWIHVRDAANLALFCVENPKAEGPINATSPHPLRNGPFTIAIARRWRRKARFKIPGWLVKMVMGEAAEMLLESVQVFPRRALELGFKFHSPNI